MCKLYELNARLFSQKFVDNYIFKNSNTFLDIQLAMKECFIPMFASMILLKNTLQEKSVNLSNQETENLLIGMNSSWLSLCDMVRKNKMQKTVGWKNFVAAVDSNHIGNIEETWSYFEKSEHPNIKIKRCYFQFLTLFMKNKNSVFVISLKNIPVSPFEFVKLIELVEKYEYLHLKALLKWGLRCALTDFQTFVSLPLLKCVLKEMHTIVCAQINLTLKKILLVYKSIVSLYAIDRELFIENLKLVQPTSLGNSWKKDIDGSDDKGNTWLIRSILSNDFSTFCDLLKSGAKVNDITSYGETPLILLSKLERYDWIEELLKYNPNVNAFDFYGNSCVHYFAKNNAHNMLEKVTKLGANLGWLDIEGCSALHIATKARSYESVQFLVKQNIEINLPDMSNKTALHMAIEQKCENIALLLMENKANLYARDNDLKTYLHYIAEVDFYKMIKYFSQTPDGVDPRDGLKRTPLHLACLYGHKNTVKKLLEFGADVNAKDLKGQTPLHIATTAGASGCVDILMEYGANVDNQDDLGQSSVYLAALREQKKPLKEIMDLGINVHTRAEDDTSVVTLMDDSGDRSMKNLLKKYEEKPSFYDTALFLGIIKENMLLVKEAIENGSHLKEITICDKTPMEWAIEVGNTDILRELYDNNCVKSKKIKQNIGHRSLVMAILKDNITSVRLLIKAGADVNAKDGGTDYTVLHYASAMGNTAAAELLIQNGAKIDAKDIRGKTALYFARQANQLETEGLLLSFGANDDMYSQKPVLDEDE